MRPAGRFLRSSGTWRPPLPSAQARPRIRARFLVSRTFVSSHPCLSCGACCATYRVSLHWSEAEPALGGLVPPELTERIDGHQVAMRGTCWTKQPRCIALDAEIGVRSACRIHPLRPQACRDVAASWEFGEASPQCDKARRAHGLPVLAPEDWATR
jgi:Fe-S-cluster containining protein